MKNDMQLAIFIMFITMLLAIGCISIMALVTMN